MPNTMGNHDQSTDQRSSDRDALLVRDQNEVALRRVASTEATRCTDPSHYASTVCTKDNSNELILVICSRAKMYTET